LKDKPTKEGKRKLKREIRWEWGMRDRERGERK